MRFHSFPSCLRRACLFVASATVALILGKTGALAQAPAVSLADETALSPVVAHSGPAPVGEANTVTLGVVSAAGLFLASRWRARRQQKRVSHVADFESAFRRQNGPHVRVARMPLSRQYALPLRRSVSRLGFDQ